MKERIKKLRKMLDLTQQEFADKLSISRNTVATYETGKSNPSDAALSLICNIFGVNENWLRTGEGGNENVFKKVDNKFILNLNKLSTTENEFVKNGVNFLAETDPEKLKILEDFMKSLLGIN